MRKSAQGYAGFVLLASVIALSAGNAQAAEVSLHHNGWNIVADSKGLTLTISHDRLGVVLDQVRLKTGEQRMVAKRWSASADGSMLSITTEEPHARWTFDARNNLLKISCTTSQAVVDATAPAGADRIVARLLDRDGAPVVWSGTGEVAGGYGGSYTRNPSALPSRNPECMYFTLGPVSASIFHSLFDRPTDTAIWFSQETRLERTDQQPTLQVTMPVPGNAVVRLVPDYYTRQLGLPCYVPMDQSHFPTAPMIWGSWTSCYSDVTENDIVRNADWIAQHLKPYGFQYVQLDDGYDTAPGGHNWIGNWDQKKFPHGPKWLASYVKSKGLRAGLWLVPNAYAGAVKEHPDWYLRDKSGNFVLDYGTPALDSTNPQVQQFLKKLFTTLNEWGFEYYKLDGEHALPKYVPAVDRNRLYDKSIDPVTAYRQRLQIIHQAIGPNVFLEGCPAGTPLNGIGYFNSYFTGQDVYNNWNGMHALLASINGNAFLNRIVVYIMPGEGMELGQRMTAEEATKVRPPIVIDTARTREEPMIGFGVTDAEARTLVSTVSLSGVTYSLASVLPELPPQRVAMIHQTLPTMPIYPADLFSRGMDLEWDTFKKVSASDYIHNFPEIVDLKVNASAGVYDVVALVNWRDQKITRRLSLAQKLGLDLSRNYLVFDYWNHRLLGEFRDEVELEIEPHDTRLLQIHPLLDRPQLISNSRHISGSYSILSQDWDAAGGTLCGSSQTVMGDPYTLFIHVPPGFQLQRVEASAGSTAPAPRAHREGPLLQVQLDGQSEPIRWRVGFSRNSE